MSKSKMKVPVIVATLLVAYSVILFVLPLEKNGVFWLSYGMTVLALLAQIYIMKVSFLDGKTAKSKFYGFPIVRIGWIYGAGQFTLGLVCILLSSFLPFYVPVILYVLLLAFAIIGTISAEAMREEITRQDSQLASDVTPMRAIQSKVASLVNLCQDEATKAKVQTLADELRYSDPVTKPAIQMAQNQLADLLFQLETATLDGNQPDFDTLYPKVLMALQERNRQCKLYK